MQQNRMNRVNFVSYMFYIGLFFVVHFCNYAVLKEGSFSIFLAWVFLASSF